MRAIRGCKDCHDVERKAGEEWLIRDHGLYIPKIDEQVINLVEGKFLGQTQALLLQASQTYKDIYGKLRKAGE